MDKVLRFWVACADQDLQEEDATGTRLTTSIVCEFEEAGDAMRYLNAKGQISWKATAEMLSRLADAEQEAEDDLIDVP
jgi:hypothetical protein